MKISADSEIDSLTTILGAWLNVQWAGDIKERYSLVCS